MFCIGHSDSLGERGVGSLRRERMTNLYIPKSASATDNYPTDFIIVKDCILGHLLSTKKTRLRSNGGQATRIMRTKTGDKRHHVTGTLALCFG